MQMCTGSHGEILSHSRLTNEESGEQHILAAGDADRQLGNEACHPHTSFAVGTQDHFSGYVHYLY